MTDTPVDDTAQPAEEPAEKPAENQAAQRVAALEAELEAAQARNAELESALHPPAPPQPRVEEVYVREGTGLCLGCSWCKTYEPREDRRCKLCGHLKTEHRRHPDGARFREV